MTLTLHHAPRSRSTRILWLLEELGADYQVNYVDISRQTAQAPRTRPIRIRSGRSPP